MKVIFLLDNNAYLEVPPENLQLRQLGVGQAALGVNLNVPVRNEDGTPKVDAEGRPQTVISYYPLINYAVDTTPAKPVEAPAAAPAPEAQTPAPAAAPAAPEAQTPASAPVAKARQKKGK